MFGLRISDGTKIKGTMDSPHPAPAKSSTEVIDKKNTEIKTSANIKNNPVPGNPPKREASTAGSTSSNGIKEKNKTNENSVEGKGDSAPQKKEKGENKTKEDSESEHMLGESGTQIGGSKTTGQNGETERVDVENPAPGKRPGDVHYHEPNNTKWRYDANSGKLVDPSTGEAAPPKVQKVLGEKWFRKAIEKALEILGELL